MTEEELQAIPYTGGKKYKEGDPHDLNDLKEIIAILRKHCPWDKKQNYISLKDTLVNEVLEVCAAIDEGDDENLCEELGDVLFQLVFMADIGKEEGTFTMEDVIQGISDKMIRRHPHVFAGEEVHSEEEINAIWKRVKKEEKMAKLSWYREKEKIVLKDHSGKKAGEITFPYQNGMNVIDHTWVSDDFRGIGLAGVLVEEACKAILEQGHRIGAECSYARSWLQKQSKYPYTEQE